MTDSDTKPRPTVPRPQCVACEATAETFAFGQDVPQRTLLGMLSRRLCDPCLRAMDRWIITTPEWTQWRCMNEHRQYLRAGLAGNVRSDRLPIIKGAVAETIAADKAIIEVIERWFDERPKVTT